MDDNQAFKERITGVFSRGAGQYGQIGPQFFNHFGRSLVNHANIQKGAQVLDIACGRGSVLFPAGEMTGASGQVIGIDLAEGMIDETRQVIQRQGLANLVVRRMDAESLQFPADHFDVVVCGFAIFFFPNQDQALAEILRVLKPGGTFATSTFNEQDARWNAIEAVSEAYYKQLQPPPQVEIKRLKTRNEIIETLSTAGFEKIVIVEETREFYYRDADEWWATLWTHGYRSFLEMMDAPTLAAYQEEVFTLLDQIKTPKGIPETVQVFLTRAVST
jgi:O-methyltransferase/aklanonic acid methyltransferase